jgi:hypothetical protein
MGSPWSLQGSGISGTDEERVDGDTGNRYFTPELDVD